MHLLSTWLTHDSMSVYQTVVLSGNGDELTLHFDSGRKSVVVKAFTGHTTDMHERTAIWEADALWLVSQMPSRFLC